MSTTPIILLENVRNLGKLGDTVKVKGGYARNFLIPSGIAVRATQENQAKFEARREELEKRALEKRSAAEKRLEQLNNVTITIRKRLQTEEKLFGSVGTRDIIDALSEKGITVAKKEINLPSGPIRQIGEYEIDVQLHSDLSAKIKLVVEPEA
jgi:large subunit ribosomal protein L9